MKGLVMIPLLLSFSLSLATAPADEKAPSAAVPRGVVHEWKGPTGRYRFAVPKSYDDAKGATLLLMLHGSNLNRRWALANFKVGEFRKDDILVAPDGTTPAANGAFNFMAGKEDVGKVADLIRDLKGRLNISRVYIYGHSQGAYFTYYFIGEYPDLVDGICAHAGGVLAMSRFPEKAKKIAVGILHSGDDPIVPVSLSEGAEKVYKDRGYKDVFFKRTEQRRHFPDPESTGEVLAWCDRVTVRSAAESLKAAKDGLDLRIPEYADSWNLAQSVVSGRIQGATKDHKDQARALLARIEGVAGRHREALLSDLRGGKRTIPSQPKYGAWVEHYRKTIRSFPKTKAVSDLRKKMRSLLRKHALTGAGRYRVFKAAAAQNQYGVAFKAGRMLLESAFLSEWTEEVTDQLAGWMKEYKNQLPRKEVDGFQTLVLDRSALDKQGLEAWERVEGAAAKPGGNP